MGGGNGGGGKSGRGGGGRGGSGDVGESDNLASGWNADTLKSYDTDNVLITAKELSAKMSKISSKLNTERVPANAGAWWGLKDGHWTQFSSDKKVLRQLPKGQRP